MEAIDAKTEAALGGSASAFDPAFSQSREAVTHSTPAREVALREGEELKDTVERLQAKIRVLEDQRAPVSLIQRAEEELNQAVEAWVEFATAEEEEEAPGADLEGYIPLGDLLRLDLDSGHHLDERELEVRVDTLKAFNRYAFQDGIANIWLAFKNWLAVVRRVNPEFLDGISKADLAILLGETRAATCDREIRVLEKFLQRSGVKGFKLLGGNKGSETRRRCSESAMGNQSRRKGAARNFLN